ncbi:hypothetical protein D3C84_1302670 [compost metagenome]
MVDLFGTRCDLGIGEAADRVTQRIDLFTQREGAHNYSWQRYGLEAFRQPV